MARNHTYIFIRQQSTELPPRFKDISKRLESIGVYGAILSHPDADWNQINLTIGINRISREKIEQVFRGLGYSITTFPAPTFSDSRMR